MPTSATPPEAQPVAGAPAPDGALNLAALLAAAERGQGRLALEMPVDWMQGRTVYGGLSAALAFEAARSCLPDPPPLRSLQVAFLGPFSGRIEASAQVLRQGRSASFVQADVGSEAGLGLRATFLFSSGRPSALEFQDAPAPPAPDPENAAPTRLRAPPTFFSNRLEYRHALPRTEGPAPEFLRWVRLADGQGVDPTTALLAVADALPPAAMPMMAAPGPVSSATWMMNLLTAAPATVDGWWLLRARAEQARDGVSSQSMAIWNRDRQPIAIGMQSVAIFG